MKNLKRYTTPSEAEDAVEGEYHAVGRLLKTYSLADLPTEEEFVSGILALTNED